MIRKNSWKTIVQLELEIIHYSHSLDLAYRFLTPEKRIKKLSILLDKCRCLHRRLLAGPAEQNSRFFDLLLRTGFFIKDVTSLLEAVQAGDPCDDSLELAILYETSLSQFIDHAVRWFNAKYSHLPHSIKTGRLNSLLERVEEYEGKLIVIDRETPEYIEHKTSFLQYTATIKNSVIRALNELEDTTHE